MKHRFLVLLSVVMILALALTGCQTSGTPSGGTTSNTPESTSGTTYKIAIVVPLSGDVKPLANRLAMAR